MWVQVRMKAVGRGRELSWDLFCRTAPSQLNKPDCRLHRCRLGKCLRSSKPAEGLVRRLANQTSRDGWTAPDDRELPSNGAGLRSRQYPFGYPCHARPRENTSNIC